MVLGPVIGIIDTQPPSVVSVALNNVQITDADTGQSISATVTFSEPMDQNVAPVVTNNASTTLTNPSGHWQDATHFIVSYTTADANINLADVTFDVSGAQDFAGNAQVAASGVSSGTAVDTTNPGVTVNIVDGSLSDGNTGSVVTFEFSEAPGASFTEADIQVSAGLTLDAGSLSMIDATHYQATVTANDGFTGTGTVSLAAGSWTDAALNLGGAGSDTVPIDRQNPGVTVNIVDGSLSDGNTGSVVTFEFSEAPGASFTEADIQVSAGLTLDAGSLSMIDATHYQATVTANDGFAGTGTVSLAAGSWTDAALNLGGAGSDTVPIDRQNPGVTVNIVDGSLSDGNTGSVVTFEFSEAPGASFTEADIQVSAGLTLDAGSLSMIDATHYQATVTANDGFAGTGTVSLAAGSWTDAALNLGGAGSDTVPIDRQNPGVTVNIVDGSLSDGNTGSVVTFEFSEAPGASFTEADIQVSAGLTLDAGSLSMIDATHYQATVTANDGFTGTGTVSLAAGSWTDAALNLGGAGSDTVPIDRQNPGVTVNIVDGSLSDGNTGSVVTFEFSEAPGASFTEADIQVSAGLTLDAGSLSMIDATHYQATVTANDGFTGTGTVSLAAGSWTDAALNLGGAGSDTVPIDRQNPGVTVNIVDGSLSDGNTGSVVTFEFSEAPGASFTEADIQVSAGLTLDAGSLSMIDATHYQATVTANDGFTGTGTVSLAAGSWTDAALNLGGAGSDTVPIDRQNPGVTVNIVDGSLSDGNTGSVVTFEFSEAPGASFTEADIQVSAGLTLDAGSLSMIDATHYQATVTANDGFTGTGTVSLAAGSWTDAALNLGGAGSDTVPIDRQNPGVTVNIVDGSLSDGNTGSVVTFEFSEAPGASFTEADIQVSAGLTLDAGSLSMIDATHYQATVTANDGFTGTGTVSLAAGSWTDAALNLGGAGSDTVPIDRQNPGVTVNIVDGSLSDGNTGSVVTFEFSEAPGASFTEADIQVSAGLTLDAGSLSMIDATHYQATVTANDGFTGTGTVSLAAGSWTDAALNLGGAGSDTVPIDRQNPGVTVNIVDGSLSDGDNSSVVTFTFSEVPINFTAADISFTHGNVTGLALDPSDSSGKTYKATFTADDNFTGTGSVTVGTAWQDGAGNTGVGADDTVSIDTQSAPELKLDGGTLVVDQFITQNYGSWFETNDNFNATNGSPTQGEFTLAHDPLATTENFQIRLSDLDDEASIPDLLSRTINLSGATAATFSFDYRRDIPNGDAGDDFVVEASNGNGTWTTIGHIGTTGSGVFVDGSYQHFTFNVPASLISANTTFRFSVGDNVDDGDVVWVDNIKIAYANPAATPATQDFAVTYTENGTPVPISVFAQITDVDSANMATATITLENHKANDLLAVNGTLPVGITASSYNAATGVLTLTGPASKAAFQTALSQIVFSNSSDAPDISDRIVHVVVNDGTDNSNVATATIHVTALNDAPTISNLNVTETSISFNITDPDNSSFTLPAPFGAAFGGPTLGGSASLTPTEQGSAVSGTLQVTDGAGGTANVIGLYLGTSAANTSVTAPLASSPNAMYGFGGNDKLIGGTAGDFLFGGAGNDTLVGGAGDDTLTGGSNADQFRLATNVGKDTIADFTQGTDKIGFLDTGSNGSGSVNFANTTGSLTGAALNASDFASRTSITNIQNGDDETVIVISNCTNNRANHG